MIKVTEEDFNVDNVLSNFNSKEIGCVVNFVGVVRGVSEGDIIERMDIEVYPEMAEKQLNTICNEALEMFGVEKIVVIHRHGRLKVGDNILLISVASGHRKEAFSACQYVIDEIKKRVPIWKKEYTQTDEKWVEVTCY